MSLSKIPPLIAAFAEAAKAGDTKTLCALFDDGAAVSDAGERFEGQAIGTWCHSRYVGSDTLFHPINVARRSGQTVLTVMLGAPGHTSGQPGQIDHCFRLNGDKIAALDLIATEPPAVAPTIAAFIRAMNSFDLKNLLATFADDAMVNDQLQEIRGKRAIGHWAADAVIGARLTLYVEATEQHHSHVIIRANVDGDYDKRGLPEPLRLSFYFYLEEELIVQLFILHNQPVV